MTSIQVSTSHPLLAHTPLPFDQHPAAVYLASLPSERSRRVLASNLRTVAALLTGVDVKAARQIDIFALDWAALRYSHTAALRSRLIELYSPATVNRI